MAARHQLALHAGGAARPVAFLTLSRNIRECDMSRLNTHLTIGEIAAEFNISRLRARYIVDSLGEEVPRAGLYRMVPRSLLPKIKAALDALESKRGAANA